MNVIRTWNNIDTPQWKTIAAYSSQIIDLPLEVASNQLTQFLGIKHYTNYVLKMSWHALCWSVSHTTP